MERIIKATKRDRKGGIEECNMEVIKRNRKGGIEGWSVIVIRGLNCYCDKGKWLMELGKERMTY